MKNFIFKILIITLLITPPVCVLGQNDAFFYENYDVENRDGSMGFSFDNFNNGAGLGFGSFNNGTGGFGFGGFSDNDGGFGFGDFSDNDGGFGFGDFDFAEEDVPAGDGLLLLCVFATFYLTRLVRKKQMTLSNDYE